MSQLGAAVNSCKLCIKSYSRRFYTPESWGRTTVIVSLMSPFRRVLEEQKIPANNVDPSVVLRSICRKEEGVATTITFRIGWQLATTAVTGDIQEEVAGRWLIEDGLNSLQKSQGCKKFE